MNEHAPTLRRVEQEFGVPGAMTIVLWGLETDFGTHTGKHEVLRATATLGFDCRRSEMFQNELFEALSLVQKGDLSRPICAATGPASSARRTSCRRPTTSSPSTSTATASAT